VTEPTTIGVSIPIPSPHGDFLQERRAAFGDAAAWRIPAHITLLPPTAIEGELYEEFIAHCKQVAAEREAFEVVLRGTGTFRPISDVVYIQVAQGVSACERLETALRSGPIQRNLDFYYHPHVTVAHNVSSERLDQAFEELAAFHVAFRVDAFHLYVLGTDQVWRPTHDFRLRGSQGG